MKLSYQHIFVLSFTLLYIAGFAAYYLSIRNFEFMWYIAVMLGLTILLAWLALRKGIPTYLLWLLSFWGLLHVMGGGVRIEEGVLYAQVLFPFVVDGDLSILKFDQLVHAYGFGVVALLVRHLIVRSVTLSPFGVATLSVLAAMGLGAVNEVVEFIAVLSGPTGVGGYFNTSLDLVANTFGAVIAVAAVSLWPKKAKGFKLRTYAFDFDGVIAKYEGRFVSDEHTDPPNHEVIEVMRELKRRGHSIVIFSTRSNKTIAVYAKEHDIPYDYINENPRTPVGNPGKPRAHLYIDDHALRYTGQNTRQLLREIESFVVHYKQKR